MGERMVEANIFYFIFAILYWVTIVSIENQGGIIVGFSFLFVINLLFTLYFGNTQILNGFSMGDEFIINLGKASIMINGILLILSLICLLTMIDKINRQWNSVKGTSFKLDTYYQNNMDMFIKSVKNNVYYEAIIIIFIVLFKNSFNKINQFDNSLTNGAYEYAMKFALYILTTLTYIWYSIRFNQLNYLGYINNYITKNPNGIFQTTLNIIINIVYWVSWLPLLFIAAIILFLTEGITDIYKHGFRYAYVIMVPILSCVVISFSIQQLYLAGSFTKVAQHNLIT
jgi:hypothetical protein